ncbi:hypothetical protein Bbelb_045580 [Branchiostoma belcheri]|nr:hypothetical protein Bbelb_045580 [Branchiostoma belcheri]
MFVTHFSSGNESLTKDGLNPRIKSEGRFGQSTKESSQDVLGRQYPACRNGESRWILFSSPNWAIFSQNKPVACPLPPDVTTNYSISRPGAVGQGSDEGSARSCPLRKAREDEQLLSLSPTLIQVN